MDVAVELSLYPLRNEFIPPIAAFIERLNTHPGLKVETNSMSTQVVGEYLHVMQVLTTEIERTFASGVQDLAGLVESLNRQGMTTRAGQPWTEENYGPELAALSR